MERNRRIAKAYARKHTLTVNGSEEEYLDGTTLGLNLFDNPERDAKTRHIKQYIGQGIRIKITQEGDILVKRMSKANVFVHRLDSGNNSSGQQHAADAKISNSSSDLYAMNSDAGEFYGVIKQQRLGFLKQPPYTGGIRGNLQDLTTDYESSDWLGRNMGKSAGSRHDSSDGGKSKSSQSQTANSSGISSTSSSGEISFPASKSRSNGKSEMSLLSNKSASDKQALSQMKIISKSSSSVFMGTKSIPLEHNRPVKIFDMSKFKAILERESRKPCPNRKKLQSQCISIISFVLDDNKMLNLPSWILIINIVAIDLLKTEIGLIDPHDLLGPTSSLAPEGFQHQSLASTNRGRDTTSMSTGNRKISDNGNMFMRDRRLGALMSTGSSEHGSNSAVAPVGSRNGTNQRNQFAAAKLAFANAAALGAYNGDYFREKFLAHELNGKVSASRAKYLDQVARHDQHQEKQQRQETGQQEQPAKGENQQSPSSSGFNSHCSSQNDSSAASSSSNIASNNSAVSDGCVDDADPGSSPVPPPPAPPKSLQKVFQMRAASDLGPGMMQHKKAINGQAMSFKTSEVIERPQSVDNDQNQVQDEQEVLPASIAKSPRGKRPPKLPHRVVPPMSDPIPIPAPPTSAGAVPSGKANLILVSPTGLSPPLPKRNVRSDSSAQSKVQLVDRDAGDVLEFDTIKHIDENGKCNILKDSKRPPKLPAGIPAYAQLAPPATQRHILRYLMLATRDKLSDVTNNHPELAHAQAVVARSRRPLPILPCQKQHISVSNYQSSEKLLQQPEESLYYCGLQARVPTRVPQQMMPHMGRNPIVHRHQQQQYQRTAANLLNEFKQNLRRSQNHQQLPGPANLSPFSGGAGDSSSNGYESGKLVMATNTRPFLKFFKPSTSSNNRVTSNHPRINSSSSSLINGGGNKNKSMFLSMDNLNSVESPAKLHPKILAQVGGLLKRNKAKKLAAQNAAVHPGSGSSAQSAVNLAP